MKQISICNIIYAETAKPEMYNEFKPGDILLAFQHDDSGLETWLFCVASGIERGFALTMADNDSALH